MRKQGEAAGRGGRRLQSPPELPTAPAASPDFGAHRGGRLDRAAIERDVARRGLRLPQRDLAFAVEKLLVWAWLTRKGPLTRKWLERAAGCTYPTVASVVKRLGSALRRHPDRRVELTHVPRGEWVRLLGIASEARCTLRFADVSDQRSEATRLLRRLTQAAPVGVAVGGVAGARHYHPRLDLVGLPRVDLSVHAPAGVRPASASSGGWIRL